MHPDRAAVPPQGGAIQMGTVGWVDDGGTSADLGSSGNDGAHLVRVTLFAGRVTDSELDQSQAQGQPLLCRLADHVAFPARGAIVCVAVPEHFGHLNGASMIIAASSSNAQANANAAQGEQVWQVPGSAISMFLRKTAWGIRWRDQTKSGTPDSFIKFDQNGIQIVFPFASFVIDGAGFRLRHACGATLKGYGVGGSALGALSNLKSILKLTAAMVKVDGTKVFLGPDTPTTIYQPVPAANPAYNDPGASPLLKMLTLFATWLTTFNTSASAGFLFDLASWITAVSSFAGIPTPPVLADITALVGETNALNAAVATDEAVVTSSSVMASIP